MKGFAPPSEEPTAPGCRLRGRVAVVTGASSGIGRAIALRMCAEGATVYAVGRDRVRLDELRSSPLAKGGSGEIMPARVDLTDDDARTAFVAGLSAEPRVDLLVVAAGVHGRGEHADAPLRDMDAMYAANIRAPYALIQELLPRLRLGGGDIIVVNSMQAITATGGVGQYAATRHALRAITDSLREEVNADGIRVCSMYLGRTATPLQEANCAEEGRPYLPHLLVQPADVAEALIAIVALPKNAEITEIRLRPAVKSY